MKEKRKSWGEQRREEKERDVIFLHMGKKKKKKKKKKKCCLFVAKLGILDFLFERFTNSFTDG